VVSPRAQLHLLHRSSEEIGAGLVDGAKLANLTGAHISVYLQFGADAALALDGPSLFVSLADVDAGFAAEFFEGDARHFDMDVDPVQEGVSIFSDILISSTSNRYIPRQERSHSHRGKDTRNITFQLTSTLRQPRMRSIVVSRWGYCRGNENYSALLIFGCQSFAIGLNTTRTWGKLRNEARKSASPMWLAMVSTISCARRSRP
jgi:hypothetical protein